MKENNTKAIRRVLKKILMSFHVGGDGYHYSRLTESDYRMIEAALAEPQRNCDVGTADEQAQRYDKFCEGMDCVKCPVHALWHHYFEICKNRKVSCGLVWSQMPYEEKEGGAYGV